MSFSLLPTELQSLVLACLTPQHLLDACTHLCHSIALTALTPACFRAHLLLDNRAINALPSLSPSAFSLLTQATSLDVRYNTGAHEVSCLSFFSATSTRSLLHFTSIRSLLLADTDSASDFVNHVTPFSDVTGLLRQCTPVSSSSTSDGGGTGSGSDSSSAVSLQPLPHLTSLTLRGFFYFDALDPLVILQSLTHLTLSFAWLHPPPPSLRPLLALPALRSVSYKFRPLRKAAEGVSTDAECVAPPDAEAVQEAFRARGVTLTWQRYQ